MPFRVRAGQAKAPGSGAVDTKLQSNNWETIFWSADLGRRQEIRLASGAKSRRYANRETEFAGAQLSRSRWNKRFLYAPTFLDCTQSLSVFQPPDGPCGNWGQFSGTQKGLQESLTPSALPTPLRAPAEFIRPWVFDLPVEL